MKKILVVDDNLTNLKYISVQISEYYQVMLAKSGQQALTMCQKLIPDLILLDIDMPEMNGFEVMKEIQKSAILRKIPVIFLTANTDTETEVTALASGAVDFISKPIERSILLHRIDLHLNLAMYQSHLEDTVKELEDSLVESFAELIEYRDQNTGRHVQRTSKYVELLCYTLKSNHYFETELIDAEIEMIVRAAPLHDIGKIGISDTILLKPGQLTDEEFAVMKQHTVLGEEILVNMFEKTPSQHYLEKGVQIAGTHHEKYNGTGYPKGLKGDDIPLCSRIMAVADVYDALVSDRVYRKAFSHEKACEIIKSDSGTHFDPRVIEAFELVSGRFAALAAEYRDA